VIFGPVIRELPDDDDARELWHHVRWLLQYPNFSELKRSRNGHPDLPGWNFPAAQRTFGNKIWMSETDARNW
jgi:hypothetical protein